MNLIHNIFYDPLYKILCSDTDTSENTWRILKAVKLADDATEEDVAIIRETCAIVSEKGAKIVAAGKSRNV